MVSYFECAFSFRIQFTLYEHSSPALWIRMSTTGNHKLRAELYLKAESGKALLLTLSSFNLQAPCVLYLGQAFRYSPENAFYIFNQQIYCIT